MTRSIRGAFVLLTASTLCATGCFTAVKQAYNEVRGAQAELLFVGEARQAGWSQYRSVEFTPATTTIGQRLCPPGLLRTYDMAASQLVSRLKAAYPGGEPALTVDSEVVYFQKKGLLSGALLLARVKMHADGQPVVDAILKAESQSFRAGGENDLAQAGIEELGKFLRRQKGEPEDRQRHRADE